MTKTETEILIKLLAKLEFELIDSLDEDNPNINTEETIKLAHRLRIRLWDGEN